MTVSHIANFRSNASEVLQLLKIHGKISGRTRGRKYDVEVLNKSGIVLLVACWEAFVEDVASSAFKFLLDNAPDPTAVPSRVLISAARRLKRNKDERHVWTLAGEGWRAHLRRFRSDQVADFHNPGQENVDGLFESLLDLKAVSKSWKWKGASNESVRKRLNHLIGVRGEIAHLVSAEKSVRKAYVKTSVNLIIRISAITSNRVSDHVCRLTDERPWQYYKHGSAS